MSHAFLNAELELRAAIQASASARSSSNLGWLDVDHLCSSTKDVSAFEGSEASGKAALELVPASTRSPNPSSASSWCLPYSVLANSGAATVGNAHLREGPHHDIVHPANSASANDQRRCVPSTSPSSIHGRNRSRRRSRRRAEGPARVRRSDQLGELTQHGVDGLRPRLASDSVMDRVVAAGRRILVLLQKHKAQQL